MCGWYQHGLVAVAVAFAFAVAVAFAVSLCGVAVVSKTLIHRRQVRHGPSPESTHTRKQR